MVHNRLRSVACFLAVTAVTVLIIFFSLEQGAHAGVSLCHHRFGAEGHDVRGKRKDMLGEQIVSPFPKRLFDDGVACVRRFAEVVLAVGVHVPRLAFVNKCDRAGANPYRVKQHLIEKLGLNAVLMQIPIGLEDKLQGVVDLVEMKAYYFDAGADGIHKRVAEIPAELLDEAQKKREEMLDGVSLCDDELMEAMVIHFGWKILSALKIMTCYTR